jgi:hypothetical protein
MQSGKACTGNRDVIKINNDGEYSILKYSVIMPT